MVINYNSILIFSFLVLTKQGTNELSRIIELSCNINMKLKTEIWIEYFSNTCQLVLNRFQELLKKI